MTLIADRTVLFADLRGSTSLFETLGNAEATSVVTHCVNALARPVADCGGHVVKTLGDGLMAVFAESTPAVQASIVMHEVLEASCRRAANAAPRRACARCACRWAWHAAKWWRWAATASATPSTWPPA
jgi:class 3 adenylate cyclase